MNKLIIIGNLTANPVSRTTPSGLNVTSFTVAVNKRYKGSDGNEKSADYFRVVAWRQLGENCSRYLSKGKKVSVIGEVAVKTYDAKDGSTKAYMEVTANEIEFLSPSSEGQQSKEYAKADGSIEQELKDQGWESADDEDLPF